MRSVVLHRRPADHRLQYSLGSSVLVQEFGPDWSIVVGVGRVTSRRQITIRRGSKFGRKQAENVFAAGWKNSARIHVLDSAQI